MTLVTNATDMTRRTLILAAPQIVAADDAWGEYAKVHNAWAEKFNEGVLDLKKWRAVLNAIDRIEGKTCRGR